MAGAFAPFIKLILLTLLGYAAARAKKLEGTGPALSAFLIGVCYPAMVLNTFWQTDFNNLIRNSLPAAAAGFAATGGLYLAGRAVFKKKPDKQRAILNLMLGVGNTTFIGIPVLDAFIGPGAVTALIVFGSAADFIIWGPHYADAAGKKNGSVLRSALLNPCIVCMAAGLLLSALKVPAPTPVLSALDSVSSVVSPVSLVYLGLTFAAYDLKRAFADKFVRAFSALRVLAIPAAFFVIFYFLTGYITAVTLAVVIACPTPLLAVIFAGDDTDCRALSVNCFVFSTLLFFVTIVPLLMILTAYGPVPLR